MTLTGPRKSYRYPFAVASVEQLREEMICARLDHGRLGLCGWYCAWLDDPRRVVRWVEAGRIVREAK